MVKNYEITWNIKTAIEPIIIGEPETIMKICTGSLVKLEILDRTKTVVVTKMLGSGRMQREEETQGDSMKGLSSWIIGLYLKDKKTREI